MATVLVKDSSVTRNSSNEGLGRIPDEGWRRERAVRPSERTFSHNVVFLFFLSEDYVIYLVGECALGVFSERLTVSCRANLRLGPDPTTL